MTDKERRIYERLFGYELGYEAGRNGLPCPVFENHIHAEAARRGYETGKRKLGAQYLSKAFTKLNPTK
jgi:hypothetical protein